MKRTKNSLAEQFKMENFTTVLGSTSSTMKTKGVYGCTKGHIFSPLLERYGLSAAKSSSTPADINVKLVKDDGADKLTDPLCYQAMVGSLLYATIAQLLLPYLT